MQNDPQKPRKHGGARPGAGRKRKLRAATTIDDDAARLLLTDAAPDQIESSAQMHARVSMTALVRKLLAGTNEAARVSAANAVLDRGYGKPAVDIGGNAFLPFMGRPIVTFSIELRAEARKYANLAIEVLRRVAEFGQSESASVSAAKSLLDRGLGTVGAAKMPDEFARRPLGKKEEAAAAAEAAATGRYATPAPPRTKFRGD